MLKVDDNLIELVENLRNNGVDNNVFQVIANLVLPKLKDSVAKAYSVHSPSFDSECGDYVIPFSNFQEFRDEYLSRSAQDKPKWFDSVVPKYSQHTNTEYVYDVTDEYLKYIVDLTTLDILDVVEQ